MPPILEQSRPPTPSTSLERATSQPAKPRTTTLHRNKPFFSPHATHAFATSLIFPRDSRRRILPRDFAKG